MAAGLSRTSFERRQISGVAVWERKATAPVGAGVCGDLAYRSLRSLGQVTRLNLSRPLASSRPHARPAVGHRGFKVGPAGPPPRRAARSRGVLLTRVCSRLLARSEP